MAFKSPAIISSIVLSLNALLLTVVYADEPKHMYCVTNNTFSHHYLSAYIIEKKINENNWRNIGSVSGISKVKTWVYHTMCVTSSPNSEENQDAKGGGSISRTVKFEIYDFDARGTLTPLMTCVGAHESIDEPQKIYATIFDGANGMQCTVNFKD